jgi:hypothetical protein
MASEITAEHVQEAAVVCKEITAHLDQLLANGGGGLMVPSTPGPGPILNCPPKELDEYRGCALALTSIAGYVP